MVLTSSMVFVITAPHHAVHLTLSGNGFTGELDNNICDLSVFEQGSNVEFSADCDICTCELLCSSSCPAL